MKLFLTLAAIMAICYASVLPRQGCRPLQDSVAPEPVPNTPSAFASYEYYSTIAKDSGASLPGYSVVTVDASASVRSTAYLNYHYFASYDVAGCSELCDDTEGCQAFNMYFERSPAVEPAAACPNPEARATIVCGLYSQAIQPADVTNSGQSRGPAETNGEAFKVVIRGSNVWNKRSAVEEEQSTVTVTATTTVTVTSVGLMTTVEVCPASAEVEGTSNLLATSSDASSTVESPSVVASPTFLPLPHPFGLGSPLLTSVEEATTTAESNPVVSEWPVSSPDVTGTPWLDLWTRDLMTVVHTIADESTTRTVTNTMPFVQ